MQPREPFPNKLSVSFKNAKCLLFVFVVGTSGCGTVSTGPSGAGSINDAWTLDGKCQAVEVWVSQLQQEYPNVPPQQLNVAHPGVPNLLRDKYFVPVFGVSYSYANATALKAINDKVLNMCYGARGGKHAPVLGPYKVLFDYMLIIELQQGSNYSNVKLVDALAKVNAAEKWMETTFQSVRGLPLAEESFAKVDSFLSEGSNKLKVLWPRELKSFVSMMTESKANMARALVVKLTSEVDAMQPTLVNARRIQSELLPNMARYQEAAQGTVGTDLRGKCKQKIEWIVTHLVQEHVARLKVIPETEAGLRQSQEWFREFEGDLSSFRDVGAVGQGYTAFAQRRGEIFRATKTGFLFSLNSLEISPASLAKADSLIRDLFPLPSDSALPVYAEYLEAVRARKDLIVNKLIVKKLEELRAIQPTVAGAIGVVQWRADFEGKFDSFKHLGVVREALNECDKSRERILREAKRDFAAQQAALPQTRDGLRKSVEMLDAIFPALKDEDLPVYGEYRKVVLGQISARRGGRS